jgi:hypothetical protein
MQLTRLFVSWGSPCKYIDTTGHPTICYGHVAFVCFAVFWLSVLSRLIRACSLISFNLDDSDAQQLITQVGGNYQNVVCPSVVLACVSGRVPTLRLSLALCQMAGGCLTQSQCTQLLQIEVNQAASQEQGIYGEMYACCFV